MMSQSEDSVSFSLWNSSEFWNNLVPGDFDHSDAWSVSGNKSGTCLTKFTGMNSVTRNSDKSTDQRKLDTSNQMPVWTSVGSVFRDVHIPSIWSTSDLYSTNDQNLSLSGPNLPWPHVSRCASEETADPGVSVELWDSQEPLFEVSREPVTWKCGQSVVSSSDHVPTTTNMVSTTVHLATDAESTLLTSISDMPTKVPSSDFSSMCSKVPGLGNGPICLNPGAPAEEPVSATAFSADQLCEHLINSNDGWGRRPIDQSTPWDVGDVPKTGEHAGRSGITTPTPGRASALAVPLRGNLQTLPVESNIWTSEPPTGTGIWEMHYEISGSRSGLWNTPVNSVPNCAANSTVCRSTTNPLLSLDSSAGARSISQLPNTAFSRQRPWDPNEKLWNSSGSGVPAGGRPVLGGSRGLQNYVPHDDMSGWCGGSANVNGGCTAETGVISGSWDGLVGNSGTAQWGSAVPTATAFLPSFMHNTDEMRRQQTMANPSTTTHIHGDRMLVHPFSNTYRADLVKYLMNQGFKKEDAQAALIDCNMDPERALQELRERYNACLNSSAALGGFPQSGASAQFQAPTGQSCLGSVVTVDSGSVIGPGSLPTHTRHKFSGGASASSSNNHLMASGAPPNPQLIRQQITQQVRSALNMSLPNPLGGSNGNNHSVLGTTGNSLLGQPPPPLLNGSVFNSNNGNTVTGAGSNLLSGHNRNPANGPGNIRLLPNAPVATKRSDRQVAILTAIHDLQKKYQTIQQQLFVYRNNPSMCSQPQYADVFTELQGQMQQIEAQLRAKQAQLNIACAQDCAASNRGQSLSLLSDVSHPMTANTTSQPVQLASSRANQDQLVQQLMELRLRPGGNSSNTEIETDFPTIGTWTALPKGHIDNQDKLTIHDTSVPRSLSSVRSNSLRGQSMNSWSGNWQSGALRAAPNWHQNMTRHSSDGFTPNVAGSDSSYSSHIGFDQQQPQLSGQWLVVTSPVVGGFGSNLNILHTLLSQYGLTYFHVLNSSSSSNNSVLVRLQSPEFALQFIRAVGDRLLVEPVTDPDAIAQLHNRYFMSSRSEHFSGPFNPTGETTVNAVGVTSANWMNTDAFMASTNSATLLGPKTSSHNTSRISGVMVSGIH